MCLMLQVDRFNLRLILPFLRANFRHWRWDGLEVVVQEYGKLKSQK
jgi:hypothetical protein